MTNKQAKNIIELRAYLQESGISFIKYYVGKRSIRFYYLRTKIKDVAKLQKEIMEQFNLKIELKKSTCLIGDNKWLRTQDLIVSV